MTLRVLLADDHETMRQGLRLLLEKHSDMEVVAEANDGQEAIELADQLKPDVVVMDVNMPGVDGADATRRIVSDKPETRIVALSMHSKKGFIIEMLKAGASAYVLKENAFSELVNAINTVMGNEIYLSSKITRIVVDDYVRARVGRGAASKMTLTDRENEVLKAIEKTLGTAAGLPDRGKT